MALPVRSGISEVALSCGIRKDEIGRRGSSGLFELRVGAEKEEFVAEDRSARADAEVMLDQLCFADRSGLRCVIRPRVGIQAAVAEVVVRASMEVIAAASGNIIELRTGLSETIAQVQAIGDDAYLLGGVVRGGDPCADRALC